MYSTGASVTFRFVLKQAKIRVNIRQRNQQKQKMKFWCFFLSYIFKAILTYRNWFDIRFCSTSKNILDE